MLAEAGDSIKRFIEQASPNLATSSARCCGNSRRPRSSTRRISGSFWNCCRGDRRAQIRHVVEPRHETFSTPAFIELAREFEIPIVYTDHADYLNIADITGDFVYARLQRGKDKVKTGYPPKDLDTWAKHASAWASGKDIASLPHADKTKPAAKPRDAFIYFIHEGKVRAPAAAMELIRRLK